MLFSWLCLCKPPIIMTSISSLKQSLYYEIAVSKLQGRINLPEEAVANPHHIYKQGIFHRFRNPYPSYGEHPEFVHYLKNVVWWVVFCTSWNDIRIFLLYSLS